VDFEHEPRNTKKKKKINNNQPGFVGLTLAKICFALALLNTPSLE